MTDHNRIKISALFFSLLMQLILFFGVVFFYVSFDRSLFRTFLFLGFIYLAIGLIGPVTGSIIQYFSPRVVMFVTSLMFFLSFVSLFMFSLEGNQLFLIAYFLLFVVARSIYFDFYLIYYNETLENGNIGKDIGQLQILIVLLAVITPSITGILIESYGTIVLMILSFIYAVCMYIPFISIQKVQFTYKIDIKSIFVDRAYRNILLNASWDAFFQPPKFLWSIVIFLFLNEEYRVMGIFIAGVNLLSIFLIKLYEKKLDKGNRRNVFEKYKLLSVFDILLRSFYGFGGIFVFVTDLLGRVSQRMYDVVSNVYLFSWIESHEQKELIDDRAILASVIYNITYGLTFILIGFLSLKLQMGQIFFSLGLIGIIFYLLERKLNKTNGK